MMKFPWLTATALRIISFVIIGDLSKVIFLYDFTQWVFTVKGKEFVWFPIGLSIHVGSYRLFRFRLRAAGSGPQQTN